MKPLLWITLTSIWLAIPAQGRTWTSVSGKQIEADFVSEAFGQVTLKTVGRDVRQIVGMRLLRQCVLTGAGHCHIKVLVHSLSSV